MPDTLGNNLNMIIVTKFISEKSKILKKMLEVLLKKLM